MAKLVFSGLHAHVDAANSASHSLSADLVGKAKVLKPVLRAQDALAQAIEGPQTTAHQNACVAEAMKWRDVMMLGVDAVERGILAVCTNYSLTPPTLTKNTNET